MEPIISPWIIYWISVFDKLGAVTATCAILGVVISLLITLFTITDDYSTEKERAKRYKWVKRFLILASVCALINILTPSKETMLTMLALEYVTPDNITAIQGNIVEFVQQLSEAVKEGIK